MSGRGSPVTVCDMRNGSVDKSGARISSMFDAIAPRYDLLNTMLSGGS